MALISVLPTSASVIAVVVISCKSTTGEETYKFIDENTEYLKLNDTVIFHANNHAFITPKAKHTRSISLI